MEAPGADQAENEARFAAWLAGESARRERVRLQARVLQLEKLQLASYGLMWFWVAAMFCGYRLRPALISAEVAGLVTVVTFFGGAFIVWHIIRLKRETQRRIESLEGAATKGGEEP